MKEILSSTTGGTTASSSSEENLVPSLTSEEISHYLGEYHSNIEITYEGLLRLDSDNMQPEEWQLIARRIAEAKSGYDGIVLGHGIDTMAHTAGALPFMLCNLDIPLIMTGNQLPLLHPLGDDVENTRVALTAVREDTQGMYVCLNKKIMLATRVVKARTINFDTFESASVEPCGRVDARGPRMNRRLLIHPTNAFALEDELRKEAMLIKLVPGTNPLLSDKLAEMDIRDIVIEAFDTGGISFVRRDLISKLKEIAARGIGVVIYGQCLCEYNDFSIYQTGQKVLQHGAIQSYDMTSEACVTKPMWALGKSTDTKEVKRIFETDYVNEITLPQARVPFCLRIHVKQKLLSTGDPQLVEGLCLLMPDKQHESRGRPFTLPLSV